MNRLFFQTWRGSFLGLLSLLFLLLCSFWPWFCEYAYARGLFQLIRLGIDYSWALLPVAAMYWFWPLCLYLLYRGGRELWRECKQVRGFGHRFLLALRALSNTLGWLLFLFLFLWGYNYRRIPLEEQLGLARPVLDVETLLAEAWRIQDSSLACRARIAHADSNALEPRHFPSDLETEMRTLLVLALDKHDYPSRGRMRCRSLYPKGLLLGFGASGLYWPFIGEGHIDAALHITRQPFTMAHELAHGYGFGDEAPCNFWGFLACMQSQAPAIRYSGFLNYRLYLLSELRKLAPKSYEELIATNSPGLLADQRAARAVYAKYPEFFPATQKAVYHHYLKSQGVKEGLRSYNRVVELLVAYKQAGYTED